MNTPTTDPLLELVGLLAAAGKLALHNGRGGFACNSSSSHSIVVLPAGRTLTNAEPYSEGQYGSNAFALTDSASKIRYLAALVADDREAADIMTDLKTRYGVVTADDDYVDHESRHKLPNSWHNDSIDPQFLTEFAHFLASPDVAIFGGSDSSSMSPDADQSVKLDRLLRDPWKARKDTLDGQSWWTLFNDSDGTKLRISFDAGAIRSNSVEDPYESQWREDHEPVVLTLGSGPSVDKAPAPELVDIKLTDACPFESDCGFCYMGSTKNGPAGDASGVRNMLAALASLRVFEVAFGGGEPTLWPAFTDTLKFSRSIGIVPNFTTKNYSWLTGPNAQTWFELMGSVAFSVNDRASMDRLVKRADAASLNYSQHRKISIQLIPDLVPADEFKHIVTTAASKRWRVTLLGYKEVGRGATFTPAFPRPAGWWYDTLSDIAQVTDTLRGVAIDTALALSSKDKLDEAGIPKWMYHVEEGTFSAYVDAVTGHMGPSSYTDPAAFTPLDLSSDIPDLAAAFTSQFLTYTPEAMAR